MRTFFLSAFASLLLLLATPAARAQTLACGLYADAESGARLDVIGSGYARLLREAISPKSLRYRVEDGRATLYDVDDGYADRYTIDADARTLTGEPSAFRMVFALSEARACAMVKRPPPGVCESDLDACFRTAEDADDATLNAYCAEGLPFACVALIERFQRAADGEASDAASDATPVEAPPECREGAPTFSASACETFFARTIAEALATSVSSIYADETPLASDALARLPALCADNASAKLCGVVADKLWNGARYRDARTALQRACALGDEDACRREEPLATLADGDFETAPMTTLPCGRYVADTGLMSEFVFGDRGAVSGGFGASMRARLQNGDARIRHDKGGDFVLRRLIGGRLIGIDSWNRYALYRLEGGLEGGRDGGAGTCAAPVTYRETALVENCPQPGPKTPEACCASGSLHGCNIVGHRFALEERWHDAATEYLKVCAGDVRIGCENAVRAYAETGDETIPERLAALCEKDARSVACDVAETTNWATIAISKLLDDALGERPNETPEASGEEIEDP
ncbi:MAG: hypothetical protein E6Q50_00440 [Lysobacter sp.]|nr:MAG: hypothetical protein E6Q50_00440 [Lysobacter sp.]